MARFLIYRRVSTDDQADSGAGMAAQLAACEAAIARAGGTTAGVWDDPGVSGGDSLDARPGLVDAVGAIRPGDVLIVAKRDRLARDLMVVAMLESAVAKRGGRIVSAAGEGTDDDSPGSILQRRIIDLFAEFERLTGKLRTRTALQALRKQGKPVGTIPYGFCLSAGGHVVPDLVEQAAIERMGILRAAGATFRELGTILENEGFRPRNGGTWSTATLSRLVNRCGDAVTTNDEINTPESASAAS